MTEQPKHLNIDTQWGRIYAKAGKWGRAEHSFSKAVLKSPDASTYYYLGNAQFKRGKFDDALVSTERAVSMDSTIPAWLLRLGALNERHGQLERAAHAYETALELEPANAGIKKRLAKLRKRTQATSETPVDTATSSATPPAADRFAGLPSAEVRILTEGSLFERLTLLTESTTMDHTSAQWLFHYGATLLRSARAAEAIEALEAAQAADPSYLQTGYFLEVARLDAGAPEGVRERLRAMLDDRHRPENFFGGASFFAERGDLRFAETLYQEIALVDPTKPTVWFELASIAMEQHDWAVAQRALVEGLALAPGDPQQFLALGFCLERQGNFAEASPAYAAAIRLADTHSPVWCYRSAFSLYMAGRPEAAVQVFKRMYPEEAAQQLASGQNNDVLPVEGLSARVLEQHLDSVLRRHDSAELLAAGKQLLSTGLYATAIVALTAAIRQDPTQDALVYFLLGLAHEAAGDQDKALQAFLDTQSHATARLSSLPPPEAAVAPDSMEYVHLTQDLELEDDLVLFESYHGSKIDCNPAAIYRALRSDPVYSHLRFAWIVTSKARIPQDVLDDPRVSLIPRTSRLYLRALATAKHLVSNVSFPNYFVRRDGQQYLNTWHGTPLKSLGRDIAAGFMEHTNVSRNLLQVTHLLAPNQHTQDSLIQRYEVEGLFSGEIARLGSPRIDRMLNQAPETRLALLERLGLEDDGRKIVFYAPTWRGTAGNRSFDATQLAGDLERLSQEDYHVVFRAHHLAEAALRNIKLNATVVPADIDTYDVLALTDLLITDYSSIFFDFLPLRRPIVFHAYDLAEYSAERGLYFEMQTMPGELAATTEELQAAVERGLSSGIHDVTRHEDAIREYASAEDGHASAKAIGFFFGGETEDVVKLPQDQRQTILVRYNFDDAPGTDSLVEILENIDDSAFRVVVTFDRSALVSSPENQRRLASLPAQVQRIMRAGGHVLSAEEKLVLARLNEQQSPLNQAEGAIARAAFQREYRRVLGGAQAEFALVPDHRDAAGLALLSAGSHGAGQLHAVLPAPLVEYYLENGHIGSAGAHWLGEAQATPLSSILEFSTTPIA